MSDHALPLLYMAFQLAMGAKETHIEGIIMQCDDFYSGIKAQTLKKLIHQKKMHVTEENIFMEIHHFSSLITES